MTGRGAVSVDYSPRAQGRGVPAARASSAGRLGPAAWPAAGCAATRFTDGELVTLALNGAQPAFSHLLQRHAQHLQRLVKGRLRDPDDVLDVIQDTHFAVWRALQTYDAKRPFQAWLTSIALNKCRDWARRRLVRLALISQMQADFARQGEGIEQRSAESLAMGEERVRELERALGKLPEQLREPLILTALLEVSQTAAARELRATRKAVEMRVRRARQRLERELEAAAV